MSSPINPIQQFSRKDYLCLMLWSNMMIRLAYRGITITNLRFADDIDTLAEK